MTLSSAAETVPQSNPQRVRRPETLLPTLVLAAGLVARLLPASRLFLNPDEALHNLLASQSSLGQAWNAALTNAHPPLLILLLYCWRMLGHSELWLRTPSILAGTAACWLIYAWLRRITDHSTAFIGLLLFSFAPSLILLSAEIRQYALLLFFEAACLYLAESALQENSPALMALFSLSLYGALLTHYSALIFAFATGVYLLVRLYPYRDRPPLSATWAAGQIVGIAIAAYFLLTHIPRLKSTGVVRTDLESYLRKATYHSGERNPAVFLAAQTLRVFTYLLSHGLIGTLVLLAFLAGIVWLLRRQAANRQDQPSEDQPSQPAPRQIALLIAVPLLVNWIASLAALYPLGATRHNAFLAPFAIAGACIGINWLPARNSLKCAALSLCLAVCNLFPAPPAAIRSKDQSKALMASAIAHLQASAPAGSTILTDYESGLLLGYYLCGHSVVQVFPPQQPMARAQCGPYSVEATSFRDWKFVANTFPAHFANAAKNLKPGTELWLFYSGWINDSAPALRKELPQFGCPAPQTFGENILVCKLSATKTNAQ